MTNFLLLNATRNVHLVFKSTFAFNVYLNYYTTLWSYRWVFYVCGWVNWLLRRRKIKQLFVIIIFIFRYVCVKYIYFFFFLTKGKVIIVWMKREEKKMIFTFNHFTLCCPMYVLPLYTHVSEHCIVIIKEALSKSNYHPKMYILFFLLSWLHAKTHLPKELASCIK